MILDKVDPVFDTAYVLATLDAADAASGVDRETFPIPCDGAIQHLVEQGRIEVFWRQGTPPGARYVRRRA